MQDAAARYEDLRPGLGLNFVDAVNRKTDEILEAPKRWRIVAGTRRVLMGRFPYGIVYREISDDEVEIVAVAHLKRRSGYWASR